MKKRILSLILALSMVLSVLPLGAFAEGFNQGLTIGSDGYPTASNGNGWSYDSSTEKLTLRSGTYDFSSTAPVQCAIYLSGAYAKITGGTFDGEVTNKGTIENGTFNEKVINGRMISNGIFKGTVTNGFIGTISGGTFAGSVENRGTVTGGVFKRNATLTDVTGLHSITWDAASSKANIVAVNDVAANWAPYAYKGTTVIITADTEIFSLNGYPISGAYNSSYPYTNNKKIVKFTMPYNENVALSTGELVMAGGYPIGSNNGANNYNGKGWAYSAGNLSDPTDTGTLHLWSGTFDFNFADPTTKITRTDSAVACEIQSYATIIGGIFAGSVKNGYTIENGTFTNKVENSGYINNGTFAGNVTNSGAVNGGVFNRNATLINVTGGHNITWGAAYFGAKITEVNGVSADWNPYVVVTSNATTNEVTITADTEIFSLNGKPIGTDYNSSYPKPNDRTTVKFTMPDKNVVLNEEINYGDFVMKDGYPEASNGGKTPCWGDGWEYDSSGILILKYGTYDFSSTHPQNISAGTQFAPAVQCAIYIQPSAEITGGTFSATVKNHIGGTIFSGTFDGIVENKGTITGGIFAAGLSKNSGNVTGGVFNGNTALTDARHVTVTDGSLLKVNGEDPRNVDETTGAVTTGTAWDLYSYAGTTVTITADTEIFSLNGQPIGAGNCNSSYGSDKKTVKFTMPDDMPDNENVVLNKAITSTDLVMKNGYPKDSDGGKNPCKGDGWQYIPNDPTNGDMLLLTGSNQTGGLYDFSTIGDGSAVECNVFVGKPTAITGGEFKGKVFNNSGILGGTFNGEVENMGPGRIMNGTFKNSVENKGMIENGTFEGTVENNTNGTISGGTFAGSVSNNGGTVNGGIFNGNTGLDEVTDLHSITVASGAKIEKVNGVPAEWAPYVVTSNATTKEVTITADTEIFSLNGQPIAESSYGVDKKTVTFTMPDDDVVLNGELITKPEPEPEPEPEPTTYTVTVIGGTIDGKTSVSAKENDTLTVVLDQNDIPDGMTFDMWSISSSKLSGDINVDYRAEAMTFQMPPEDVTIRAQYRSAEIIEDAAPSPLATAATIAVGGAAAGIVVWQGVSLGVDLYLANALPQGVPVPTDRRALALLLWETAGKPEVALPTLYGDIPAEEIELQKATRWAVQNGLMDAADKKDASFFDPDHYVTKMDVFGAWLRLKKLLGTT